MRHSKLRRFRGDQRGLAIVEFALVVPVLITLSTIAFDLVRYVIFVRKIELAASTMADLVARNDTGKITQSDIVSISRAQLVIFPEAMSTARDSGASVWTVLKWSLSGVQFRALQASCTADCTYEATVSWTSGQKRPCAVALKSAANTATPSSTTLPADTFGPKFLIVADVVFSYKPVVAQSVIGTIDIAKSFYISPRYVSAIAFDKSAGSDSANACSSS